MSKIELQHKYHCKTPGKSFRWKKKLKYFLVLIILIIIIFWLQHDKNKNINKISENAIDISEQNRNVVQNDINKNSAKEQFELCTIGEGDIPADIFSEYGKFDANDTVALLSAAKDVYDFTNLKIGQDLRFYFSDEKKANRMEYDLNTEQKIIVERNGDNFEVRKEKIEYEVTQEIARGSIENFFYADAMNAGLSEATVLEVGDIFAFSIDFTTEIMVGDEFVFVYEKRKRDGKDAPDGRILAAKFINDEIAHYAYYFDNDGEGGYYDDEGHVLERQFLKAPLSYRRISSGYTNARLHPITKKWTAHQQVDYAAPTGTPVVASASGTITQASWAGGWGNMIRMKHDNGYTTHYGHLSAFAKGIKVGVQVVQGQLIGYVGSTGWSTGPHLDYGMKHDGNPINPIAFVQPKGALLDDMKMEIFEENKKQYLDTLK
jgi:murein DD-endopeptidase MepM/ murein hydrolase activator NlpD